MTAMKIIIIGDSHTHALKRALKTSNRQELKDVVEVYSFAKIKNEQKVGDLTLEEVEALVSELDSEDVVFSLTGGNQHNSVVLIQHPEPFNVGIPLSTEDTVLPKTLIPYQVMRSVFEKGLQGNDFKRLSRLKNATKAQVWHLAATPPKSDENHILKRHETDFAAKDITSHGVSDPFLRLQVWHLQLDVTESLCNKLGIKFMPFPKEAQDADGFLAVDYYADDATHANEAFGELMLAKIYNTFCEKVN